MGTINWTKDQQQIIDMRGCNIFGFGGRRFR